MVTITQLPTTAQQQQQQQQQRQQPKATEDQRLTILEHKDNAAVSIAPQGQIQIAIRAAPAAASAENF